MSSKSLSLVNLKNCCASEGAAASVELSLLGMDVTRFTCCRHVPHDLYVPPCWPLY